jgi:hypothetical protein
MRSGNPFSLAYLLKLLRIGLRDYVAQTGGRPRGTVCPSKLVRG